MLPIEISNKILLNAVSLRNSELNMEFLESYSHIMDMYEIILSLKPHIDMFSMTMKKNTLHLWPQTLQDMEILEDELEEIMEEGLFEIKIGNPTIWL